MEIRIGQLEIHRPVAISKGSQTLADFAAIDPGQAWIGKGKHFRVRIENEAVGNWRVLMGDVAIMARSSARAVVV